MDKGPEIEKLKNIFSNAGVRSISYDIDTSELSSMKVGGRALCLIEASDNEDLARIIETCMNNKIRFKLIGDGTNIIFGKDHINMALIKLGRKFKYLEFKPENRIIVGAAYRFFKFVVKTASRGYDFSALSGIPGTIGGGISGNSGNSETGICDFVESIEYISEEAGILKKKTEPLDKTSFGYRYFNFPGLLAVTSITLKTSRNDSSVLLEKIRNKIKDRKSSQPDQTNNSGCFFKNPQKSSLSAGQLIDKCRLKGFVYGGARVSGKHANFIENYNNASPDDVAVLSRIIRDKVKRRFKIDLKYEIEMIG